MVSSANRDSGPRDAPASDRSCARCGERIAEERASYCPGCGANLKTQSTLDSGRYQLLSSLGEGGMGQVYLAEDTRLKVQRALKLLSLPPGLPTDEVETLKARLLQEARATQALSALTHHVVTVFDVGFSPERGEPFLVMELLKGETLAKRLAQGPLPPTEAVALARTVAETLDIAHQQGIVHRDLKPDNIMLVQRGDEPHFVKLLDFGLVKMDEAEVRTASGRMMGTLQYMPPEQLRGERVDARADLFSLGAVLYECLAGERANPGRTQREIFAVLLDQGVTPLASRCPKLPARLCALVDACLQLDREARPASAREVAALLASLGTLPPAAGSPALAETLAPEPSQVSLEGEAPRRARWPWALAAGVGLTLAGALFAWKVDREPDAASPAKVAAQPVNAEDSAGYQVYALFDDVDGLAVKSRVVIAGLTVGEIAKIELAGDKAKVWLKVNVPLKSDARVTKLSAGRLGEYFLQLTPGYLGTPLGEGDLIAFVDKDASPVDAALPTDALPTDALPADALLATDAAPVAHRALRGLGRLQVQGERAIFEQATCAGLMAGDELESGAWTLLGYGGGSCKGERCAKGLDAALKQARSVGEALALTLKVRRAGVSRKVSCHIRP